MTAKTSKAERRENKLAARARRQSVRERANVCVLCGAQVPAGQMLAHKEEAHGEARVVTSPLQPHRSGWVSIWQGGLPGLGRRSR